MENRENKLSVTESELASISDETAVVTEAGEDDGEKDNCPQKSPCIVR